MRSLFIGIMLGLSATTAVAKTVNWESNIKDKAIRDFREATYAGFWDVQVHLAEQDRKMQDMQKQIKILQALVKK